MRTVTERLLASCMHFFKLGVRSVENFFQLGVHSGESIIENFFKPGTKLGSKTTVDWAHEAGRTARDDYDFLHFFGEHFVKL